MFIPIFAHGWFGSCGDLLNCLIYIQEDGIGVSDFPNHIAQSQAALGGTISCYETCLLIIRFLRNRRLESMQPDLFNELNSQPFFVFTGLFL